VVYGKNFVINLHKKNCKIALAQKLQQSTKSLCRFNHKTVQKFCSVCGLNKTAKILLIATFAKANASKKCNISPQKQKIDCNAKQGCNKS